MAFIAGGIYAHGGMLVSNIIGVAYAYMVQRRII